MHGVKRSDHQKQNTQDFAEEEAKKIENYKTLVAHFSTLYECKDKNSEDWALRVLTCTGELLSKNCEYYTAWNERKRAITVLKPSLTAEMIKSELIFNVQAIKTNPKSYCTWYHRRWFLEKCCEGLRELLVPEEVALLSKLLDLDTRNFHGWNYRIWLAKWANLSIEDEFDFTTLKIYQNFSNYSAWQRRSHLFVDFVAKMSAFELDSFVRNEVELCRNAAWTEPSDQSIWFYQRWLFESLPHQLPSSVCDLLQTKLAREQVDSISKLIDEEKQGNCVALAMSFVRFVLLKVLNEANDSRVSEYLDRLEVVDPLRRGHWNSMK